MRASYPSAILTTSVVSVDHLQLTLDRVPVPADAQRRAAVAAIIEDGRVLLMVRAARDGDPWSGHISLPGGGYQPSDIDLLTTAMRETREEIGVDLAAARIVGNLPPLHPRSSGGTGIEVTPFVFVPSAPVIPQLGPEAVGTFWLPLALAASGALDGSYSLRPEMTFPCWTFEGHTIWGMTWRILVDLLARAARTP